MEIFKIYEYVNGRDSGIIFNNEIELGDLSALDRYKWIKYRDNIKIENKLDLYQGIAFNNVDISSIEMIKNIFNNKWSTKKYSNFTDLFIDVADIFKEIRSSEVINKYLGLLGELAFIKKSQMLGINNILDFYSNGNIDRFDFHFKDNHHLDIKIGNILKSSFKLGLKQLEDLTSENKKHDISIIFPNWDSKNGMNLLDLFNSIDGIKSFQYKRDMIDELKNENIEIFEKFKIVIEKSNFIFFNKDLLPKISVIEKNVLINATFEIFAAENTNIDFEFKVKELTNNE